MAKKKSARSNEGCELDMTPMIDVVFQLMIFFIVTFKMDSNTNPDIKLDLAPHAPAIEEQDPRTLVIEVDKRGVMSIHTARLTLTQLRDIIRFRYKRMGEFPVLIRGDGRAQHKEIRQVMDACSQNGIWKINFCGIKEIKAKR